MIAIFGRYIVRTIFAVIAIVVLSVASLYLILDTQRGSDWLLHRGLALASPEAEFNSYSGSLARGISLQGLHLPLDGADIRLEQLTSSWNLWGVLSGRLPIHTIHLNKLTIRLSTGETQVESDSSADPNPWPNLGLPISVAIEDVSISQLRIIQNDKTGNESEQLIEQIKLSAVLGLLSSKIKTFSIQTPTQQLSVRGQIKNKPPYALDLNLTWATLLDDIGQLSGVAKLRGDLSNLQLNHKLTQPSALDTQAEIHLPFDAKTMSIDYRAIQVSISNQWQNFKSPANSHLADTPLISSGSLSIDGEWQDYKLRLDTKVTAPSAEKTLDDSLSNSPQHSLPGAANILATLFSEPGQLTAKINGKQLNIAIAKLAAKTSAGELLLTGKVNANNFIDKSDASSAPTLSWQLALDASDIDSSRLLPEWPARVSAKLNSSGQWQGDQYQANVEIVSLRGEFLAKPVQGKGTIALNERGQAFNQIKLLLGDNHVQLDGTLADTSALRWQIDARDLQQILPALSGALYSEGSLHGGPLSSILRPTAANANTPEIKTTLNARELQYQGYTLEAADLDISLNKGQSLALNLNATNLSAGPLSKASIKLQGSGTLTNHTLSLALADHDQQLDLNLTGGLGSSAKSAKTTANPMTWQGHVQRIALNHPQLGPWQTTKQSALSISGNNVKLGNLCLIQEQGDSPASLCSAFAMQDKTLALKGYIHALSLDRLSTGLPPGSSIQGNVDSEFNVEGSLDQPSGEFSLQAAPIVIRYQAGADEDALEHHASLSASAKLKNGQVNSEMQFAIADVGSMTGSLNTSGLDPASVITGSVVSKFDNLLWLGGFFPELEKLDGNLNAALAITGTISMPTLLGAVDLNDLHMQLPAIGLALNSGSANLNLANAGDWQLDAGISSGTGRINLNGQGVFKPSTGPIGDIMISGENFTAVDLPDANVLISPDITISLATELLKIRGSLTIPQGKFTLKSLPTQASSVSADEVIISSKSPVAATNKREIDTQITITLNDSFQFGGYGLNTRLGGKLRIVQKPQSSVQAFGSLSLYDGIYKAYGQDLSIQRGLFLFQGPVDNPGLNITAVREVETYQVGINIGGFAQDIRSDLFSDPVMPPTDVISMLITGKVPGAMSQSDANQVMNAATSLGISQSKGITNTLQNTFGMDVLNLQGGDSYEESSLVVGKYLTPDIFISYVQNLFTPAGSIQLDYTLSKSLGLKAQSGETQSIDLLYRVEHGKD
mgnify:CR=1 FL=1